MAGHQPVEEDPKQLEKAQNLWKSFMAGTKWSILLIVLVVIALALAFVPSGG